MELLKCMDSESSLTKEEIVVLAKGEPRVTENVRIHSHV